MNKKTLLTLALLGAFGSLACADSFDFNYRVDGNLRDIVQVFDNGTKTWFQPRNIDAPRPAFFAVTAAGQVLLEPKREGSYLVIERVERVLEIVSPNGSGRVTYTGKDARLDAPVTFGLAQPIKLASLAPVPLPAEQILALRKHAAPQPVEAEPQILITPKAEPFKATESSSIPFAASKTTLGPIGKKRLGQLVQPIFASPSVTLVARTSDANMEVAKQRLLEVTRFLKQMGVPAEKLNRTRAETNAPVDSNGWVDFGFEFDKKDLTAPTVTTLKKVASTQDVLETALKLNASDLSPKGVTPISEPEIKATSLSSKAIRSVPIWKIDPTKDKLISEAFRRWCQEEGSWKLSWEAPRDFKAVEAEFTGSLEEAIEDAVFGLRESDSPVKVRFVDDGRNKTVRILKYTGNSSLNDVEKK